MKMHYQEDRLYFYLKGDVSINEQEQIKSHLDSCPSCRQNLEKVSGISSLFGSTMQEPPALKPYQAPKEAAAHPWFVFKPGFAAVFTTIILLFSGLIVLGLGVQKQQQDKKVSEFVYSTYETVYDFDYYQVNYLDKTEILNQ